MTLTMELCADYVKNSGCILCRVSSLLSCQHRITVSTLAFPGLWGSAFAGAIRKWVQALLSKRPMMRKCINKILAWTGLNDLRPLAAMLPNYMKGISSVPESTRCIGCSMEELFSDHLPPGDCLSLDYQANQESGIP